MLSAELSGRYYSKAEHRRNLLPLLANRTEAAIERKHGNISAVLIEQGFPYIEGYKPFANYQQLLFDVVADRLGTSDSLERLAAADVEAEPISPSLDDILSTLVSAPHLPSRGERLRESHRSELAMPGKYRRVWQAQRNESSLKVGL